MLRLLRLFKVLKPLRVIHRAPGLKLVVQSLLISLKPIGNIVLICCTFFLIFGILGVQVSILRSLRIRDKYAKAHIILKSCITNK